MLAKIEDFGGGVGFRNEVWKIGAGGKGSDEEAGLSARLGPAISGEQRMTMGFLPLQGVAVTGNRVFQTDVNLQQFSKHYLE